MEKKEKRERMARISDIIDISRLERENRKYLYLGFAAAIMFHAMLFAFITHERVKTAHVAGRIVKLRLIETVATEPLTISKRSFREKPLQRRAYRYRSPSGRIRTSAPPGFRKEYEPPPVDIQVKSP